MSRHGGSHAGRGLQLFQIEVMDFAMRNGDYKTIVIKDGYGRQKIDIPKEIPCRTLLRRSSNAERAKGWARKFGLVISCHKVDTTPYLKNIEFLNLTPKPIAIEREREYIISKTLEVRRDRKEFDGAPIDKE